MVSFLIIHLDLATDSPEYAVLTFAMAALLRVFCFISTKNQQPLRVRGRREVTVLYLLVVLSRSGHRCAFSKIFL